VDTLIRRLDAKAMLVGMSGRVHKVVSEKVEAAFAQAKVRALHVQDVTGALDRVGTSMPQVVVLLGTPADHANAETLADCAEAIGAGLVFIDPSLDDPTLEEAINLAVDTAIHRKLLLDDKLNGQPVERSSGASEIPIAIDDGEDVDEGW
jgi:hypothetical protein